MRRWRKFFRILKVIITGGNGTQTLLPLEPFSETASGSAQTGGGELNEKDRKRIIGIVVLLLIVVLLQGSMGEHIQ